MMGEALEALKMETFWRENDKTEIENALQKLGILDVALTIKDSKMAPILTLDEITIYTIFTRFFLLNLHNNQHLNT